MRALWQDWCVLKDTKSPKNHPDPDGYMDRVCAKMIDLEVRIIDSPARTLAEAYVQMALLNFWAEDAMPYRAKTAHKRWCERIHIALETASSPDPIIKLVQRAREARKAYCDEATLPSSETDAFDKAVLTPAEDALRAAKPTTKEGVAVVLDFALEALERDASHLYRPLFENARDAMRRGVIC